ncbi:MAG: hypothetical protein IIX57_07590 [Lachnospiraceae bacterium]|nr:hypothetical protein [Lachnospiraceae bacterium]
MGLFNKNQNQQAQPFSQRQQMERRYASARMNLLWVVLFTAINIVLLVSNSYTYFLFSAFIPYAIVDYGMIVCGKYPADFYGDLSQYQFFDSTVLVVLIAVAAVICVLYLLCWIFSKKRRVAWLIVGLVFFALDTVFMLLGGISADRILDIVFHGWVIISLTGGIIAHSKLKKLPAEEPAPVAEPVQTEETASGEELTQS